MRQFSQAIVGSARRLRSAQFALSLASRLTYDCGVRRAFLLITIALGICIGARAESARVLKVLPHYLDEKGRESVSPSLFDRDAYQVLLRDNPTLRSAVRFDVHWKARGYSNLVLRLELRGGPPPRPKTLTLEQPVRDGIFARWTPITLDGERYKKFGEVIAWRATVRSGTNEVAEQKSFLW